MEPTIDGVQFAFAILAVKISGEPAMRVSLEANESS